MLERVAAYAPLVGAASEIVHQLALIDPLAVTRALARAMKRQTTGARAMIVRRLVDDLDSHDPGCMSQVASELSRHAWEKR